MGSSLAAALMSLWGWVSEASRPGPWGGLVGWGRAKTEVGGRDRGMVPWGGWGEQPSRFELFPCLLSQLWLDQSPSPAQA